MGNRLSAMIKTERPPRNGLNSKGGSTEEDDLSGSSSKLSTPYVGLTPLREGEILHSNNLKSFTFIQLRTATRNFRRQADVLGEGGFDEVYKGWIDEHTLEPAKPWTGIAIALKGLNQENPQGYNEWLTGINYLGGLHHPNLVKLIGYCLEDNHRVCVGEFFAKRGLDNHLFRRGLDQPLSWDIRVKIALGAAKGLAFLHSDEVAMIYRDFKTSNIVLDSNNQAKLSVFGLTKDHRSDMNVEIGHSIGYLAPEKQYTGKGDVYSFGVVLLEIMSGRRAVDKNRPSGEHNLVDWAKPLLVSKRKIQLVMDTCIEGQYSLHEAIKVAHLAFKCLSKEPKSRPNMDEVVRSLEQLENSTDTIGGEGASNQRPL